MAKPLPIGRPVTVPSGRVYRLPANLNRPATSIEAGSLFDYFTQRSVSYGTPAPSSVPFVKYVSRRYPLPQAASAAMLRELGTAGLALELIDVLDAYTQPIGATGSMVILDRSDWVPFGPYFYGGSYANQTIKFQNPIGYQGPITGQAITSFTPYQDIPATTTSQGFWVQETVGISRKCANKISYYRRAGQPASVATPYQMPFINPSWLVSPILETLLQPAGRPMPNPNLQKALLPYTPSVAEPDPRAPVAPAPAPWVPGMALRPMIGGGVALTFAAVHGIATGRPSGPNTGGSPSGGTGPSPHVPPRIQPSMPRGPRPPARNVRERKVRSTAGKIMMGIGAVSEFADLVDNLFDALPKNTKYRARHEAHRRGWDFDASNAPKQYQSLGDLGWKFRAVVTHMQQLDMEKAFNNIASNELQDQIIGRLSPHRQGYRARNAAERGAVANQYSAAEKTARRRRRQVKRRAQRG